MFKKLIAGAIAVAAFTTGLATPASAGPGDGEGCAGFPTIPDTYVCVITVTPQNAVPTTTTAMIPVTVPRFCYVAGCTGPTTVNVPVPGVQPGSGVVATLWYKGQYIPIAVGTVPALPPVGGVPDTDNLYDDAYALYLEVAWTTILLVFDSESAWYEFYGDPLCNSTVTVHCL